MENAVGIMKGMSTRHLNHPSRKRGDKVIALRDTDFHDTNMNKQVDKIIIRLFRAFLQDPCN